jgi:hypothetical protein
VSTVVRINQQKPAFDQEHGKMRAVALTAQQRIVEPLGTQCPAGPRAV